MAYANRRGDSLPDSAARPLWYVVALAGISVLGFAMRAVGIARYPKLIYDEFYYVPAADVLLRRHPAASVKNAIPGIDPNLLSHPPFAKELIAAAIYLLGQRPWVWRLPGLLMGSAVPVLVAGIAVLLFRDRIIALAAAALAALDGLSIVMSRVALPDGPAVTFVLAGLWMMLWVTDALRRGQPVGGWRWTGLGVLLGLALASEWIGGQAMLLVWVWFLVSHPTARRAWRRWVPATTVLPFVVYYSTYFYAWGSGYQVSWLPNNPFIAFFPLQWLILKDMWTLTFFHPWTANAWSWIGIPRPTAMILSTTTDQSIRLMAFSDPLVVWTGLASLFAGIVLVAKHRSYLGPWAFLTLWFLAFYATWLASPRSKFLYYFTTASLGLDMAAAAGLIIAWRFLARHPKWDLVRGAIAAWAVVTLVSVIYLAPLWVGMALPRPFYHAVWWPPSWNPRANPAVQASAPSFSLTMNPVVRRIEPWTRIALPGASPLPPASWTQFRGTATHNSVFGGPFALPHSYTVKLANAGIADAPAVVDGTAFVGTSNDQVYAINLVSGSVKWGIGVPNTVQATPLVAGNRVVVALGNSVFRAYSRKIGWIRGTGANGLMALNAATGTDEWYAPTQGEIMSTPVIAGHSVYAVTGASRLVAVNLSTGRREWSLALAGFDSLSSPVVLGHQLYVATNQYFSAYPASRSTVWSINLATHRVVWSRNLPVASGLSDCSVAANINGIFVEGVPQVSNNGQGSQVSQRLYALNRESGRLMWARSLGRGQLPGLNQQEDGTPLAVGAVVYAGSPASNRVEAFNADSGKTLWTHRLRTGVMANPVLLGSHLLVAGINGRLMLLNATTGATVAVDPVRFGALGPASPLIIGHVLLQSTMRGDLAVQQVGH